MKKSWTLFLTILIITACNEKKNNLTLNNEEIISYIENLNDSEWKTVYQAKDSLEKLNVEALPYLISNLNEKDKFVKLKNCYSLIYPGATEFYGEGMVIDYDIDWLSIRTGWVIEQITFENFGFKELKIREDELINMQKDSSKYEEYLKSGYYNFKINPDKIKTIKKSIEKTNNWWNKVSNKWTRLQGITKALKSNDFQRQACALEYLRFGEYKIAGLTDEYYEKELKPVVVILSSSENELVKQQAENLLGIYHFE